MAGAAATLARRASPGLDLGSLGPKALGALADFAAGLMDGAMAPAAGVATFFGVLFIPSSTARGQWVKVAAPGDISCFHNPDEILPFPVHHPRRRPAHYRRLAGPRWEFPAQRQDHRPAGQDGRTNRAARLDGRLSRPGYGRAEALSGGGAGSR